ncbi:MAG TPA: class I SAM-dependent methyltransferase [Ktedonobacterales bacterium]|nr:class I SAM-dependent methyltransferase [Ktedonobacterales bacterium]
MPDYTASNRALWNAWTAQHTDSDHHRDVARFRATGSSLRPIERAELGDVSGKSLLHLQCNMGCDTLSWARLGASVTGVDLSDAAIERGRSLATEAGLPARFLQSDLYALPDALDEQFDIVYTSYGALCWLPDLDRWARLVARYVKPDGIFYMVEMHPTSLMFAGDPTDEAGRRFEVAAPYFHRAEPLSDEDGRGNTVYGWTYGLGEVVTALLDAGLRLDYLHEFPMSFYQQFPALIHGDDEYWRWPATSGNTMPLLFSLRARK